MSLFSKYDEPGRGIPKAPVEKKGFFKFMEIYGRRGWKLVQLNLIYLLALIPIVTFGPATAAMTKVCRNWSQERNAFVWEDFWEAFRKNFKQGFIMGLIDLLFIVGFAVAIPSYSAWAKQTEWMYIPLVICLACCIVFFMMHFYIYLMIVSTNLSLGKIIKTRFPREPRHKEQPLDAGGMDSHRLAGGIHIPDLAVHYPFLAIQHDMLCGSFQLLPRYTQVRYTAVLRRARRGEPRVRLFEI